MDKSFKQKTGSSQKLKSPKVELRTADESTTDITLWAEQINSNNDKRLEVKSAKVISAFSCLVLVACGTLIVAVASHVKDTQLMFAAMGIAILLLSTMYIGLVFRVRPLYEIDERGITDHGLMSRGFGLIEWKNIQSVRTFQEKGSTSLLVKVDNYNELLERRNLLLRPYLWMSGIICAILGGEITLSMTLGNQPQSTILERISHFSRESGRDVMAPKRGFVKEVSARAMVVIFFLIVFSVLGLLGFDLYKHWLPHMSPKLEVLGASWSYPNEVPLGKSVSVGDVIVQNYGGDSRGINVELSGSAFDKKLLSQPRILVHYDEKPEDLDHARTHTREILSLHQNKNVWSASSALANMPHKDDTMMDTFKFFSPYGKSMLKQGIGWWSDTTAPNLTVQVFADATKKGSGDVTLKVIPLADPGKAVSQTLHVKCDKKYEHDMQLCSVGVPKNYPVSLYPGGQIMSLLTHEIYFDSDAQPAQIASYYKNELERRGWKPSMKEEKSGFELNATKKGDERISVSIARLAGHSPVWINFWPSYH